MSNTNAIARLTHMLEAAVKAVDYLQFSVRPDLERDEKLALAVLRLLEVVGEAAKSVPPEVQRLGLEVPWSALAKTRDRLIHGYFEVDLDIIWQIVKKDLPVLIPKLESLIAQVRNMQSH